MKTKPTQTLQIMMEGEGEATPLQLFHWLLDIRGVVVLVRWSEELKGSNWSN